jgi:hypothetical protein
MCRTRTVKQLGRCKTCKETRCLDCGRALTLFVRMIHTVKFRKKQWENRLYEHETTIKTHTYERLCINPLCVRSFDPSHLDPEWKAIEEAKAEPKKSFDEAVEAIGREVASL